MKKILFLNRAFSLSEGIIALSIIALSITILASLAVNYFVILNSVRQRFLALNLAQEGLELALALRNKQIETDSSPWLGISSAGKYCLSFNTSTWSFNVQSVQSSLNLCQIIPGYSRILIYEDLENSSNTNLTISNAVRVTSEVSFGNDRIKLNTIITKWHPFQ